MKLQIQKNLVNVNHKNKDKKTKRLGRSKKTYILLNKKKTKKNDSNMKEIASVDYATSEMELFDDDGLCRSTSSLKIAINATDDETNVKFIEKRASSNSNLLQAMGKTQTTITHARSENTIPSLLKKKNRLISTDSGFGSYGPYDLSNSESVGNCSSISSAAKYTSIHSRMPMANVTSADQTCFDSSDDVNEEHPEQDDKVLPLLSETTTAEAGSEPGAESTPKAKEWRESAQKKRNTTLTSIDDNNFELDPKLINRDDGFNDVQCYINEDGSPMVREKRRRTQRKKSTLKEELRARSLGASYDDNLLRKDTNKTPTCVSFSRLFKKLRETFCKCPQTNTFELEFVIHLLYSFWQTSIFANV